MAGAPQTGENEAGNGAYVFVRPKGCWKNNTENAKLTASDGTGFRLGYSVSMSGNTVVAGAPYWGDQDTKKGAVYVFSKPAKGWRNATQTARLTISPHSLNVLGFSVSAMEGGAAITSGCPGWRLGQGAGFVYRRPHSGWANGTHFTYRAEAGDGIYGDRLGYSIAASPAAVAAGAPYAEVQSNADEGAAYIFGP